MKAGSPDGSPSVLLCSLARETELNVKTVDRHNFQTFGNTNFYFLRNLLDLPNTARMIKPRIVNQMGGVARMAKVGM
jgi:hypothetical protein